MKRSALRRTAPLKADPAKAAAFVQRGRGKLKAATAPSDFRDDEGRPIAVSGARWDRQAWGRKAAIKVPAGARRAALARSHGACVMCLHDYSRHAARLFIPAQVRALVASGTVTRATQVHHVFPKQASAWPHLAKTTANLVGVCPDCHSNHEVAFRRLPRAVLPPETLALAEGDGPMENYLVRTYPA